MQNLTHPAAGERLRAQLEKLTESTCTISPAFSQATSQLLAAVDYKDPALMRSHLNEALATFRDFVQDCIQDRLGSARAAGESWKIIWEMLKGSPGESYDDFGKQLESRLDTLLKGLTDLRDGPVRTLQRRGYEVANASHLERDIEELEKLKKGIFENWPWSDQALPPVDREMVSASRAAIARGERGEPIEALLRRLSGAPTLDVEKRN